MSRRQTHNKRRILFPRAAILAVAAVGSGRASGQMITEIIGAGLVSPDSIAVDAAGSAYVAGEFSHNVFKITLAGVITEIIDANGDGAGNLLAFPFGIAVDAAGNAYVTGASSHNAFRITLPPSPDCNNNGIPDLCDIDCGAMGGPCDVPGCGGSSDCNTNGVGTTCGEPPTVMCSARAASAAGGQFLRRAPSVSKRAMYLTGSGDDDSADGDLVIEFSAMGACGPVPATGVIEITCSDGSVQIPVESGRVIDLECEADEDECEVEDEDGVLEIEAASAILIVTATDAAGNTATCEFDLCEVADDSSDAPEGFDG